MGGRVSDDLATKRALKSSWVEGERTGEYQLEGDWEPAKVSQGGALRLLRLCGRAVGESRRVRNCNLQTALPRPSVSATSRALPAPVLQAQASLLVGEHRTAPSCLSGTPTWLAPCAPAASLSSCCCCCCCRHRPHCCRARWSGCWRRTARSSRSGCPTPTTGKCLRGGFGRGLLLPCTLSHQCAPLQYANSILWPLRVCPSVPLSSALFAAGAPSQSTTPRPSRSW